MKCEPKEPVQSQHSKLVTELNYGRIQCAAGMNLHRKNSQTGSGEELSQGFFFSLFCAEMCILMKQDFFVFVLLSRAKMCGLYGQAHKLH